jgi:long-chain acyl-CoA synthetase
LAARPVEPLELAAPRHLQWLIETVAVVSGKPAGRIHGETTFDELGFDSLMYAELATALEATGRKVPSLSGLTSITNMRELAQLLQSSSLPALRDKNEIKITDGEESEEKEIQIPAVLSTAGHVSLDLLQKLFFENIMKAKVTGAANIPLHTNFIVAANHSSHLDTGLVKTALGEAGKNLATVAAADYFFDNKYKRAFFENFTNVLPMERSGSIQESVKLASQALQQGFNLLIFPEGTRSTTGEIAEFKPSLGYLALRARKGILPIYLGGTFEAMPKGSAYPKSRDVTATIGPLVSFEALEKLTSGMPKSDAYRLITMIVQELVQQLKSGVFSLPDFDALRQQWNREHQPRLEQTASVIGD